MSQFENVLITGGLGFIGSAIAQEFSTRASRVTIVDSLVSSVVSPQEFISKGMAVKICSVDDFLNSIGGRLDHDLVVHAASYVGPAGILKYTGRIAPRTLATTSALAEACVESRVPLLFISSSEVYGTNGVLREDSDVQFPAGFNARLEYALGKYASEAILCNLHSSGLNSMSIRPFNVIGARQSRLGGFVVPTFVQQALAEKPLTVFHSGHQQRAFVCVDDVANFVCNVQLSNFNSNPTFNVGNPGNVCTINELAEKVITLLGSNSTIEHVDPTAVYGPFYKEAASRIKLCDINKARDFGWSPRRSLDDIIIEVADYYRLHRDIQHSDVRDQ